MDYGFVLKHSRYFFWWISGVLVDSRCFVSFCCFALFSCACCFVFVVEGLLIFVMEYGLF